MNPLWSAFRNSCNGLTRALQSERAVRQEIMTLGASVPLALWLSDNLWVQVALIGSVLLVLAVELLNTAIEKVCDYVMPHRHPTIGYIKDLGSAAVLCALLLAGLVWGAAVLEALKALY